MTKKSKNIANPVIELVVPTDPIEIDSMEAAVAALEQMEEINEALMQAQKRTVDLKKAVTSWAVYKKVDVIQLDGHYYRQIQRHNRGWDADKLKDAVKGLKDKKGKPLWNFITKRIPDPEKIDMAVNMKLVPEKKIMKCFVEKPQAPFLQKFEGEGIDA